MKQVANLILSEVFRLLPPDDTQIPISPKSLAALAQLISEGTINSSTAKKVMTALWEKDEDPRELVRREGLEQVSDEALLLPIIKEVISANPKSVEDWKNGKEKALMALMGQAMAKTKGKGNPVKLQSLLLELLAEE